MAQCSSTAHRDEDFEHGSEDISLPEQKFVLVNKIFVDIDDDLYITRFTKLSKDKFIVVAKDGFLSNHLLEVSDTGDALQLIDPIKSEMSIAVESTDTFFVCFDYEILLFTEKGIRKTIQLPDYLKHCVRDIAYVDDRLVLLSGEGKVIIKLLKGKVREESYKIEAEEGIDPNMRFVSAVNERGTGVIYIAGAAMFETNQITKTNLNGQVMMVYNDWRFSDAGPIAATGDGHLFVCSPEENCVHIIVPEMNHAVTVLDSQDGIQNPVAIFYCAEEQKLYVCNEGTRAILVYGIKK